MRFLVFSTFSSEIPYGFLCFQYFGVKFHAVSRVFNFNFFPTIQARIISISNGGGVLVIGRQFYSHLYKESDNIDDMMENHDDYIIVNNNTEYSGENLMDGKCWRTRRIQLREKNDKA